MQNLEYIEVMLIIGVSLLLASHLYKKLEKLSFSLPMALLICGMLIGWISPYFQDLNPIKQKLATEHLTELAVIVSLVGAGLKIDRDIGWKSWRITWRLLAIAMPLSITALALGGFYFMGLSLAASVLLGGAMAPTDPVLASGVQVGGPGEGHEDNVRFGLTSEAGFNDGLAFPFIHLAILLAANSGSEIFWEWISFYVFLKIAVGIIAGIVVGRIIAFVTFKFNKENVISDGLVAIALTLISYSIAEVFHGYGFIAVFLAAYIFRRYEKEHDYHEDLHNFSEQIERILMSVLLVVFGILIWQGLLSNLDWAGVAMAFIFILIIRPLSAYISLGKINLHPFKRLAISILGIRGIGSFYYVAYAFAHSDQFELEEMNTVWSTVSFIVLISIFIHGFITPFFMSKIGKQPS